LRTSYFSSVRRPSPPTSTRFPYTTLFRSRIRPDSRAPGDRLPVHSQTLPAPSSEEDLRAGLGEVRAYGEGKANDYLMIQQRSSRSEEHTSELQSRFDLVCRLLLEKKKQKT